MNDIPGSRWWKFDFHTHTPASSDYGAGSNQETLKQTTHREWLQNFVAAGIECIAVTDHHSGAWIDGLKEELKAMEDEGILRASQVTLFPGVELSINGIHYLALFDPTETTETINTLLALVRYDGNAMNAQGICEETNVAKACAEVTRLGGLLIPAHVDLESSGLFRQTQNGVLKPIFECKNILACEVAEIGFQFPQLYRDSKVPWAVVTGSDSHHPSPTSNGDGRFPGSHFTWVKMGKPDVQALRLALQDGNESAILSSHDLEPDFDPNRQPELWIESLVVEKAKYMGRISPETFFFSPWLNSVIGGRGSGKSTLVHFIRLTGRRGDDLKSLPPNSRVRESFEGFAKPGEGLTAESAASLIYRKGEDRYRLNWKQSDRGTTVEAWDSGSELWVTEDSQNVRERFPLTIFGQEQIADLAKSPQAILQRIDEAIDFPSWETKWDREMEVLLRHQSEARSLRNRANSKDRLLGQLKDLSQKLAVFEKSEHASILKTARRFERQFNEVKSYIHRHREMGTELAQFAEDFLLYDLAEDLYDASDPHEDTFAKAEVALKDSISETRGKLIELAERIAEKNKEVRDEVNGSSWMTERKESQKAHQKLVEELKEKGVENPDEYSNLLQQKHTVEKELAVIKETENEVKAEETKAEESLSTLQKLRDELQTLRENFLSEHITNNPYVRIKLVRYGSFDDRKRAEESLRAVLGCQDGRFASSILSDDDSNGIIAGLYQELPRNDEQAKLVEIKRRLTEWKSVIQTYLANAEPDLELPKAFVNFLRNSNSSNPEMFDRLEAWWPEDSLEVSYSKTGNGRNFVSLKNGSAGEKAATLLAFFLAYGTSPLVIDQPENDLDNHLITDLVVKQLQNSKTRRQIIVVSHNPNIVVNADSEMVHAMAYRNRQCSPIAQGALQDDTVRKEVCEVMEGGELALRKRYRRLTTNQ